LGKKGQETRQKKKEKRKKTIEGYNNCNINVKKEKKRNTTKNRRKEKTIKNMKSLEPIQLGTDARVNTNTLTFAAKNTTGLHSHPHPSPDLTPGSPARTCHMYSLCLGKN
jgi:hypothetical protein